MGGRYQCSLIARTSGAFNGQLWMPEGWLYLVVIFNLQSRRVIGWAVSNCIKRDLAIRALNMAVAFRAPPKACIHHTDRGSQFCSHDYHKLLRQHGF